MSRADLLALSPESVAALANLGLVKRAQREIAEGSGPEIAEDDAGVVTGRFRDGAIAELRPGKTLRETPCSCGAPTVCRHRVATALAYPAWHAARAPAEATEDGPATPSWSPSRFGDEELEAALGKRAIERGRALVRAGVVVELDREGVPVARLPTCAVRFHVPRDLAYARCDCAMATSCEHVAVAVWAFRRAEAIDPASPPRAVELSHKQTTEGDAAALDEVVALARTVVAEGVTGLPPNAGPRFARAREALARAGYLWPATLVDDLEASIDAYRAQSARYRAAEASSLVAGIFARTRAATGEHELPRRYVLGADEARETLLDHVRLVSLGARVTADERARDAEVFLADPDSGVVLVLAKRWTFADDEAPADGPALATRSIAARVTLGSLANGQVVSRAVKRRANRSLALGASRGGSTSVTPQSGAWELLPKSILAVSYAALEAELDAAPPRLLRPRVLADGVRVVAVASVTDVTYDPAEQELTATLLDGEGHAMRLVRRHRSAAPHAIDVLARALAGSAAVRYVAGDVTRGSMGLRVDPTAIVTDRLHVPDLETADASAPLACGQSPRPATILEDTLDEAASLLDEACHLGLLRAPRSMGDRLNSAGGRLDDVGLASAAARLRALADGARGIGDAASEDRVAAAVDAWRDAAVRVGLLRELCAGG